MPNAGLPLMARAAMMLLTGVLLAACGGGGGGGADTSTTSGGSTGSTNPPTTNPPTTQPPTAPTIDKVQLAAGLPASAAPMITQLVSPGGSGNLATGVLVREAGQTGEATVLALNAAGQIVLAARTEGDTASLTAATTAQALVRALLGPLPPGSTAAQLNADILAAAEFAALQTAVTTALNRGVAPSVAPEVLALVISTARQAGQAADQRRPASARPQRQAQAVLPDRRIDLPLPAMVIPQTPPNGTVYIAGGALFGAAAPQVVNGTLLTWSLRSRTLAGVPIAPDDPAKATGGGWQLLSASSYAASQLDSLFQNRFSQQPLLQLLLQGSSTDLPTDPDGRHFELTLAQDAVAIRANLAALVVQAVKLSLEPLGFDNACAVAVADVLLDPEKLGELWAQPKTARVLDLVLAVPGSELKNVLTQHSSSLAVACGGGVAKRAWEQAVFITLPQLRLMVAAAEVVKKVGTVLDMASYAGRIAAMQYHEDTGPVSVGLCQSRGLLGTVQLSTCARSLRFDSERYLLAPGAQVQPVVSAVDGQGRDTGVPVDLRFEVTPAVATVGREPLSLRAIDGLGGGTLTVTDDGTTATGSVPVLVSGAQVQPARATGLAGSSLSFALTDSLGGGHEVDHRGSGTTWRSSAPEVADVLPALSPRYPNTVVVMPRQPGTAVIEAVNPHDPNAVMRATLTVRGRATLSLGAAANALIGTALPVTIRSAPVPDAASVPRPTGTVTLRDSDGAVLCSVNLLADGSAPPCQAVFSGQPRATQIVAAYGGDALFDPVPDAGRLDVVVQSRPVLTASAQAGVGRLGVATALSAAVQAIIGAPLATGSVRFLDEAGTLLCTATLSAQGAGLSGGTCNATIGGAAGSRTLQVVYDGDPAQAAVSTRLPLTLDRSFARLQAAVLTDPANIEDPIELQLQLQPPANAPGLALPGGSVVFRLANGSGTLLCTATVAADGRARCSALVPGAAGQGLAAIAEYGGDALYQPGTAALTVNLVSRTSRWSGSYSITAHNALNLGFGYAAENPPFSLGPVAGASAGFFHFSDTANQVVLGAGVQSGSENLRNIYPLAWRSDQNQFSISIPIAYPGFSGLRTTVFTVTSRSANALSGTVRMTTTAGVFTDATARTIQYQPVVATGQWSATRVYRPLPAVQMRGYDFCFSDNTAAPQMADTGGGYRMPSWAGGFVANGCDFGGP